MITVEHILDAQKSNVETLTGLAGKAFFRSTTRKTARGSRAGHTR